MAEILPFKKAEHKNDGYDNGFLFILSAINKAIEDESITDLSNIKDIINQSNDTKELLAVENALNSKLNNLRLKMAELDRSGRKYRDIHAKFDKITAILVILSKKISETPFIERAGNVISLEERRKMKSDKGI
ncbi:MAG TPA: hypothetical protein P5096_03015 [Patescibacteria group bacterium]|nr:hypothetical protein [Patescibacteria group bacterium]